MARISRPLSRLRRGPHVPRLSEGRRPCPHCGEELHHHRADDFPAYLVIVITGHILVPIVLAVETHIAPAIWVSMTLWPAVALAMTLGLLQPVKGAVVAIQWYGGMHGFEAAKKARARRGRRRIRSRPPSQLFPASLPSAMNAAGSATLMESTIEVGIRMVAPRSLVVS